MRVCPDRLPVPQSQFSRHKAEPERRFAGGLCLRVIGLGLGLAVLSSLSPAFGTVDFTVPGGGNVIGSPSHASYPPAGAFDNGGNDPAKRWLPLQTDLPEVFIQYDFEASVKVTEYTVQSQSLVVDARSPKDWKLQGSQDAAAWFDLDTVAGETGWTTWEMRTYQVDSPGSYRYYKLVFSAANGTDTYMGFGEIDLGIADAEIPAAVWTVSHLTGDADSGVSDAYGYTCAVNVNGTEDKVVNGVTFTASSATSGTGWEITQNFQSLHNGKASNVGGVIGEVLSDRMRYNGDPQKIKMTALVPGKSYVFSQYIQAWGVGETRTATLSLDTAPETAFVNQGEYSNETPDGVLVQCKYMALGTEVEFTVDPDTNATWHLYGFSNAMVDSALLPYLEIDDTDPNAQVCTLSWKSDVTEFTVDDIVLGNATASNFQEVDARKHTFVLTPDSNHTTLSITILAASLKVGGEDNEEFSRSFPFYFHEFAPEDTPLTFFTEEVGRAPVVWFDAADAATVTGTTLVTKWEDKSGNGRHAENPSGNPAYNPTGGRWGSPVVETRRADGNDYLQIGGEPFFAKEHYYVFRSADADKKWDYYGAVLGHQDGRNSNYLFENQKNIFHTNQLPERVQQNGGTLNIGGTVNSPLVQINAFMILRIVVNDNNTTPKANYRIGMADNQFCTSVDIAEIIAFDSKLTDLGRQKLEGYLARKWGLLDKIPQDHPYRSEPPVVTLNGSDYVRLSVGTAFTDPGATATDQEDGDLGTVTVTYQAPPTVPQPISADIYPGLQLWLKADEGFSPGAWTDFSNNAMEATANGNPPPELIDNAQNGLPVMRYSGADGEYHSFSNFTDIRTVFWVLKRNSGPAFLLGDDNQYHFHSSNGVAFATAYAHSNIQGGRFAINGSVLDPIAVNVPTEMSVLSLRTTGNVEASNFSNDRNIANRYWNGDLAELLIFNTALSDIEIADIEARLGYKWGLPYKKVSLPADSFDNTVLGDWTITYTATDYAYGWDSVQRVVHVYDPDAPVLTLVGGAETHHELNTAFFDPGFTVADGVGSALDAAGVRVTGTVETTVPGTYVLAYDFTDDNGLPAVTMYRTVEVSDSLPPVITLVGGETIKHPLGQPYVEPGFSATDLVEGEVLAKSSQYVPGIRHQGFLIGAGDQLMDFSGNGGLLLETPVGENLFTGQMNFTNDQAFMDAGVGIAQPDNFNNLFTGVFAAKVSGTYEFQISGRDDRASFWVDLNRNGEFESAGSAGSEWMNGGLYEGSKSVYLTQGFYRFAIGHTEHGGGSRLLAVFLTPKGAGPTAAAYIHPADPVQEGLWWVETPINTGVPGVHTITYTAMDSLGNVGTATRTIEVIDVTALPEITLLGRPIMKHEQYTPFVDPGYSVADADGNPLDASGVQVTGEFDPDVAGTYELLYTFFDANQIPAEAKKRIVEVRDTVAPTITIIGDAAVEHQQGTAFTDPGATIGDDPEQGLFLVSTALLPTQGLWLHAVASEIPGVDPGGQVHTWPDISGNGNHFSDVKGDPVLIADGINGRPVVRVDGDDFLAVTSEVQRKYTLVTVSRWGGNFRGRLFSSTNVNNLFGYWNGREDAFHPESWATNYNTLATTNPHLYIATSSGNNYVQFYGDGRNLTTTTARNGKIGYFQIGCQGNGGEVCDGDVAEVLLYDNYVLTDDERLTLQGMLAIKYGLMGFPQQDLPKLDKVGEHTIHYMVRDAAGNVGVATRTVTVTPDPTYPIISLIGDANLHHEGATAFTDPGVTIKDGNGQDLDAAALVVTGTVDPATPGVYQLAYNYETTDGKAAEEVLRVVFVADTVGPEVTVTGETLVRIQVGSDYTDDGATATDALDGDLPLFTNLDIPADGLVLHLDAGSFLGSISPGTVLTSWPDISGAGNHADNVKGDPVWLSEGPNGRPVVNFDGNDMLWTTHNFEPDLTNYTMVSIARYSGDTRGRVISDRNRNFLFGFHGGVVRRFFCDGWAVNTGGGDTLWHFHFGTANDRDQANFWADGVQLATNHNGLSNTTYMPDQIQLGGIGTQNEMSECEVAELLVYNRVVTDEERTTISDILNFKYGLQGGGGFAYVTADTSAPGTHTIRYSFTDKSGNSSEATRTVIVSADSAKPYIVMAGEFNPTIQAGSITQYADPGATAKAADGSDAQTGLTGVGDIDLLNPGNYTLTYTYADADPAVRTITVVDTLGPEITLVGDDPLRIFLDTKFDDPGATSTDLRDGDSPVYSDYLVVPEAMRMEYHILGSNITNLYLENNGGILALDPFKTLYFSGGSNGDGINFLSDQDFIETSGVIRNDSYQVAFSGALTARLDGDYGFSTDKQDGNDYCTVWIDRDQDGLLEKAGDLGDEQILWDNQTSSVYLTKGEYLVVVAYSEWNGGSRFNARFHTPEGAGPFSLTTIHPGGPGQEGLWRSVPKKIDTSVPGEHTITYFATDSLGNRSTLTRQVIVEVDTQKPVITLVGNKNTTHHAGFPFKEPGYLLDDYQGNPLDESQVKVSGIPDGKTLGTFSILYEFTDPDGHMANPVTRTVKVQDIVPPVITINGANPATVQRGTKYHDAGAVAIDALDGAVQVIQNFGFDKDNLVLHLDAGSFSGTINDGDVIATDWTDLSGMGNHADNQFGDPNWVASGINGLPVVDFDGDDIIWTSKDFEPDLAKYTIFSVARYSGGANARVISSRTRNWLFGFWGNRVGAFYSDGWVYSGGGADTNWHLHIGDANDQDQANFWLDGTQLAFNSNGFNNVTYKPQNINLGGFNDTQERSKCQVAELLLFDRVLDSDERDYVELYLKSKYNLNGGGDLFFKPVDTSTPGEYTFDYRARDSHGNLSVVSRTVIVVDQTETPVITLTGDAQVTHPTGQPYVDEGATVASSVGAPLDASGLVPSDGVHTDIPGEYTFSYDFTDASGNKAATAIRQVIVTDQTPPVITLVGQSSVTHQLGNPFTEPGYSASDLVDGDIHVESSMLKVDRYRVRGYMQTYDAAQVDLDGNGGILLIDSLAERTDLDVPTYFNGDGAFQAIIPEITRNDHFQFVADGHFYTATGGRYEFGVETPDDSAGFWVDLDGDGIFEIDGDKGTELMNAGFSFGYREVDLLPGYHKYAIAFAEYGGGSRLDARYRAIIGDGPGTRTRIEPSSPAQHGYWVIYNPLDVLAPGEHTITYTATDKAGNVGTATRTVIVRNNPDAGIITLNGDVDMTVGYQSTFTDPGAAITDLDGNTLPAGNLVVTGSVDTSRIGEYVLEYNYTTGTGIPSRMKTRLVRVADLDAPAITLAGDTEVTVFQGSAYVDAGATALDNLDGDLVIIGSSQVFPTDGLFTHLDASSIGGKEDGDPVTLWFDRSPAGNDADTFTGTPVYAASSTNGLPAVRFDGSSLLSIGNPVAEMYSILTVSKVSGDNPGRFLSSRDQNWLLGYHGGRQHRFYVPNGWVTSTDIPATREPQLYSATSGDLRVKFYANGKDYTANPTRPNASFSMGCFQMGGWADGQENTPGDVSEVIIYDRILSKRERMGIEARLNSKYGLNGVDTVSTPVDTSKLGVYHVVYQSVDAAGNLATAMRKVTVVEDPDAPTLTLVAEAYLLHEAGETFTDPGATLKDAQGASMDTSLIQVSSDLQPNLPGQYTITYSYTPGAGSPATPVSRTVEVKDTQPPALTLNGPEVVKLAIGATYMEKGAIATDLSSGDCFVINDKEYTYGQLDMLGYMETSNDALLALQGDGGLFAATPVGSSILINGIQNRGLDFNGDGEFRAEIPEITRNDNYQNLYVGYFFAPAAGKYAFEVNQRDDRVAIWLDLDQDDEFELDGDRGSEQLRSGTVNGAVEVSLTRGLYRFAVIHMEFGGGSRCLVRFNLPGGGLTVIKPGAQPENWASRHAVDLDTSQAGTHTITYSAYDLHGNLGTATRTVVVVDDASLPFISLHGGLHIQHELGASFTDPLAEVTDDAGQVLKADLAGAGNVDVNALGQYTLTYDYTHTDGKVAERVVRTVTVVDTTAPTIAIKAHPGSGGTSVVELTVGEDWTDPGIDLTDADSSAWFVSSRDYLPNRLFQAGFQGLANTISYATFENNGGFFSMVPNGTAMFTTGPSSNGFNYANDNDFKRSPIGISDNDWFGSYVRGYFRANVAGEYAFECEGDNHMSVWLDLDQDGIFSVSEEILSGLGLLNVSATLDPGYYFFATGHVELNGGSNARVSVKTPAGAGPSDALEVVKPASASQNGLWYVQGDGPIDTTYPSTHPITYYAFDSSGHLSKAIRTVIVKADPDAPVLTLATPPETLHQIGTTYADTLPTIAKADGTPIDDQANIVPTITSPADPVDKDIPGTYLIRYDYTDGSGKKAIPVSRTVIVGDHLPPDITLLGDNPYRLTPGYAYIEPGATATDTVDGDITVTLPPLNFSTASETTLQLVYTATDAAGNTATATRELIIQDDPNRRRPPHRRQNPHP